MSGAEKVENSEEGFELPARNKTKSATFVPWRSQERELERANYGDRSFCRW
jgi:hypothetical protein